MPQFVKRPPVVEALQFRSRESLIAWCADAGIPQDLFLFQGCNSFVHTAIGSEPLVPGDYLVIEGNGISIWDSETFEDAYQPRGRR